MKLPNEDKVELLDIKRNTYNPNCQSELHSHPYTELLYVVQGEGYFEFQGNNRIRVVEDDLVIINPNVSHIEMSEKHSSLEFIVLSIQGVEFTAPHLKERGYTIHNYHEFQHEVAVAITAVAREFKNKDLYYESALEGIFKYLMVSIVRRTETELRFVTDPNTKSKLTVFIKNYLDAHYKENITLDDLEALTYYSKYHLSHIFKKETGYSPIEYLLNIKAREAKKLLVTTNHSITTISSLVGFSSPAYFSSFFKRNEKMTPTQYRHQFKSSFNKGIQKPDSTRA